MAILKHGSIKNGDYGEAQRYLLFEHDPVTQKPIHDEQGNMVLRKGYIQSGINCDPFTFNTECTELNRRFHKNQRLREVKAHHYILSFAPEDATKHGLTPQTAHAIAEEFAGWFFAGHQVLLVTHTDGHNHSGNIHTHMVLNSLRKETVPWQQFMERPGDALAGNKHHLTPNLLKDMQQRLNELCEREHLQTADFSIPTDRKVSDREYHAGKRGQERLDAINKAVIADGLKPRRTKYETIKEQIRVAVDNAVREAEDEHDFYDLLSERYHIKVTTSRGNWSYHHRDRTKPIRDRSLGRTYDRDSVLKRIEGFHDLPETVPQEYISLPKVFLIHSELRLVTNLQNCVKAQQSWAYARKVMISNLQEMAHTVAWIQEQGISTREELARRYHAVDEQVAALRDRSAKLNKALMETNEQIQLLGRYLSSKTVYGQFLKAKDKAAFRCNHTEQISEYEEAVQKLKGIYTESFPSMKTLKFQKATLMKECGKTASQLKTSKKEWRALRIAYCNVEAILDQRTLAQTPSSRCREAQK